MGITIENSIQEWRRFIKHSTPGRRFRDRYLRRQQSGHDRSTLRRACYIFFGTALAIGSLVLAPLPGPGWGTFFVGLGIVSGEVLHVARFLDRTEVELRKSLRVSKGIWGKSAIAGKVLIALTVCFGVVASVYGVYMVSRSLVIS